MMDVIEKFGYPVATAVACAIYLAYRENVHSKERNRLIDIIEKILLKQTK